MKNPISHINKIFDNRIRLGIMSILMVNENVNFTSLKEYLEITDGNLASHLKALEDKEMIFVKKEFRGRKPNTVYIPTEKGKKAFKDHLDALENLIQKSK